MHHLQQENYYVVERGMGDQEQSSGKAENRVADHSVWKGRKLQIKQTCINRGQSLLACTDPTPWSIELSGCPSN
jgi:hypothetical protein